MLTLAEVQVPRAGAERFNRPQGGTGTKAATVLPGKEGHAPGRYQLGNPDLESPAGNREVSRGSAEQSALDNQGGGSGTWVAS